jgi:hypothetical protein
LQRFKLTALSATLGRPFFSFLFLPFSPVELVGRKIFPDAAAGRTARGGNGAARKIGQKEKGTEKKKGKKKEKRKSTFIMKRYLSLRPT